MKYLRKNNEVEAVQFKKENLDNFLELMFGEKDPDVVFTDEMNDEIINTGFGINSSTGNLKINENDWLAVESGKAIVYSDIEFRKAFVVTTDLN